MTLTSNDPVLHNIDAEQALLGSIMMYNEVFDQVSYFLEAKHFYEPLHQYIYEIIGILLTSNKVATPVTIKSYLQQPEYSKTAGLDIPKYLARLAGEAAPGFVTKDYARTITEFFERRELVLAMDDARSALPIVQNAPETVAAQLISAADKILASSRTLETGRSPIGDIANQVYQDLDAPGVIGVSTGLSDLDRMVGSFRPGQLIILAGRPGMGKTTVAVAQSMSIARDKSGVAFFSLEMSREELSARCMSNAMAKWGSYVEYNRIERKKVDGAEKAALLKSVEALCMLELVIDDTSNLSPTQISSRAKQIKAEMLKRKVKLGAIFVDHLDKMQASDRYRGSKVQETGELSKAMKAMAKDLGVPVIVLAQLNRATEGREDKRPMLADLRNSGDIEQDADVVLMLYREAYYLERDARNGDQDAAMKIVEAKHKLEILVEKQRQGPVGQVIAWCDVGTNSITNMARQ